jgi:tetratricopeptide (TPR) repeat protein
MADTKKTNGAPAASEHNQNEALILKYKNVILGVIAAIIVCVGLAFLYKNYTTDKFNTASSNMAKAQEYFSRAIIDNDSAMYQKALSGDSIEAGFLAFVDEGGSVGNLANLYAGLCYAHLGQMQEADSYLTKFDAADDAMVSPAAVGALADVKATQGELDEAVALFVKAADKADNNTLSPQFLVKAGDILESQGKKEEALKLYEQIKAKYVNSVQFRTIDAYIERVK